MSGSIVAPEGPPRPGASRGEGTPRVYVLLLNWRGWADTIECLESVFRQRYSNFRVVVCDNASPDDSVDRIRAWAAGRLVPDPRPDHPLRSLSSPPVPKPIEMRLSRAEGAEASRFGTAPDTPLVLLRTRANLGFAGGNNVAIRYVLTRGDADYIWLLNNDTVVDPDALAAMVQVADRETNVGMVGSKLLFYDRPDVVQAIAGGRLTRWQRTAIELGSGTRDDGRWTEPVEVDCVSGASLLVGTEVVRRVGLLDERYFMYSEDVDWCWRVKQAGWRCVCAPGSLVWHKVGRSAGQKSPFQEYHSARGALLFVQKHFPHLFPLAFAHSLYRVMLPKLVRRQPQRLRAVLRAYLDHFRGAPVHHSSFQ